METRQRILRCAEALFQEKGYNGVSMRDIAEAAGIKVGNLTYYFPKKERLVEALFNGGSGQAYRPEALSSPEDFIAYFRHLLKVQRRHAFYFDSYVQLSQSSALLRRTQLELLEALRRLFLDGLGRLAEQGQAAPERYAGELEDRTEALLQLLMLRLPGQERRETAEAADEALLRRLALVMGCGSFSFSEKSEK